MKLVYAKLHTSMFVRDIGETTITLDTRLIGSKIKLIEFHSGEEEGLMLTVTTPKKTAKVFIPMANVIGVEVEETKEAQK